MPKTKGADTEAPIPERQAPFPLGVKPVEGSPNIRGIKRIKPSEGISYNELLASILDLDTAKLPCEPLPYKDFPTLFDHLKEAGKFKALQALHKTLEKRFEGRCPYCQDPVGIQGWGIHEKYRYESSTVANGTGTMKLIALEYVCKPCWYALNTHQARREGKLNEVAKWLCRVNLGWEMVDAHTFIGYCFRYADERNYEAKWIPDYYHVIKFLQDKGLY